MQSSYAAPDDRGNAKKQRRLDRLLKFKSGTGTSAVHGNFPYALATLASTKSAIAEADECHDVLS